MSRPLVSVGVPTFNSADFISSTVESILIQDFSDFELLIMDDRSSDETVEIIRSYDDSRIKIEVASSNLGPEANWNRILEKSEGKYLKIVCHDDLLYPSCLKVQVEALESCPLHVVMSAGRRDVIDETGQTLVRGRGLPSARGVLSGKDAIKRAVRYGSNIFGEPFAVLLRREVIDKAGLFSARSPYLIDLDYWCRVLRLGDLHATDQTIGAFRIATRSWSRRIGWNQSVQTTKFLRRLERELEGVGTWDLVLGSARAFGWGLARMALYFYLSRKSR